MDPSSLSSSPGAPARHPTQLRGPQRAGAGAWPNQLLAALPDTDWLRWRSLLEAVAMPLG